MKELPIDDVDAPLYTIGQVAPKVEVQVALLRWLDEQGVVVPSRSPGGSAGILGARSIR